MDFREQDLGSNHPESTLRILAHVAVLLAHLLWLSECTTSLRNVR